MSRGPVPQTAKDEALPIAARRGLVMHYQRRRGNICDFSVMSPGLVSFVCAMRLILLTSTPGDILHDFAAAIGRLRFIASSPAISRELWLRTPRGAWRFFRVLDESILELGPDGLPLVNGTGPVNDPTPGAGAGLTTRLKKALGGGKRDRSQDGTSACTDGAGPSRDPLPAVVPAIVPAQPSDTTAMPVNDPEKFTGSTTLPEIIRATENIPMTALREDGGPPDHVPLATSTHAAQGPVLPADPATGGEEKKIPDIIQKFLRRRNKGSEKNPGTG